MFEKEQRAAIKGSGLSRVCGLVAAAWLTAFAGCADVASHPQTLSIAVPIVSADSVSGKWEGIRKRMSDMQDAAWVVLVIHDNGTFEFVRSRTGDVMVGAGTFTIQDGKLVGTTPRLNATLALHNRKSSPVLVGDVMTKDGQHYYAELTPVR
jgi:hypothetical protein